jgi:signal transduction histidine kinase/CheY-like chemotaxis protein
VDLEQRRSRARTRRVRLTGRGKSRAWARLFEASELADALEAIAGALDPAPQGIAVTTADDGRLLARWGDTDRDGERSAVHRERCGEGEHSWCIAVGWERVDRETRVETVRAATALHLWRTGKVWQETTGRRMRARMLELDVLQELGRRAAEVRSPRELFDETARVLHRGARIDLLLAVWSVRGRLEAAAYAARPFEDAHLEQLVAQSARRCGAETTAMPSLGVEEIDAFDSGRGPRGIGASEDLLWRPVTRRGSAVGCLCIVPEERGDEHLQRLSFGAAHQVGLHLDRILSTQEAEADRFRSMIESMPQGVLLSDADGAIEQLNPAAHQLLADAELSECGEFYDLLGRLSCAAAIAQVRSGSVRVAEIEVQPRPHRVWSLTLSPRAGTDPARDGLLLVISDVTERRRLQQRLAQSEKMSTLGQLISGVAHELNNPLTSILGYTQLLRARNCEPAVAERLALLEREAGRCRRIVANLLSFARVRGPEWRPLSLNQVVQDVVGLLAYQLRCDGVELRCELDGRLPPLRGDVHQLEQVLVNLLTNARHALRARETGRIVTVRTCSLGTAEFVLEVGDNGPGIPSEHRSRIFEPFFTTKSEGEGTGLGLSLVHEIVTAHGGSIALVDSAEPGTCFRLRFSRAESEATAPIVSQASGTSPSGGCGWILVVDDEEPVAQLIADALEVLGHRVVRAADGIEALARLEERRFDLVLADLRMPLMGGERLQAEVIRRFPALATRLLFTTGDTLSAEASALASDPRFDVIQKPFDVKELVRRVQARLAGSEG